MHGQLDHASAFEPKCSLCFLPGVSKGPVAIRKNWYQPTYLILRRQARNKRKFNKSPFPIPTGAT